MAEALSNRVENQLAEIKRLKNDGERNREVIAKKEVEISDAHTHISSLDKLIKDTDLVCPECGALVAKRESETIYGYINGRDVDADVDFIEYSCGLSIGYNGELSPCRNKKSSNIPE